MKTDFTEIFEREQALQAHKDQTCNFETCHYCHQAILKDEVQAVALEMEHEKDPHEESGIPA